MNRDTSQSPHADHFRRNPMNIPAKLDADPGMWVRIDCATRAV